MINIQFPTTIHISEEGLISLAEHLKATSKRCFVVTGGARTQNTPLFQSVLYELKEALVPYELFTGIVSNPLSEDILRGAKAFRDGKFDSIVTVGGGSSHDSGKLIAVLGRQNWDMEQLTVEEAGYSKITEDVAPFYCVPLLAGTGSEISPASLVRLDKHKRIVFSPNMYPRAAYYVPSKMFTEDNDLNCLTAFDAYVQSLEAYMSASATPWSDMFAYHGMQNAIEGLLAFSASPESIEARTKLIYAAIQGLLAVSNSSVGAIHALSDPLSGIFDVHHGSALAIVAGEVLKLNQRARPERFAEAAKLFDAPFGRSNAVDDLPKLVAELLDRICPDWKSHKPKVQLDQALLERLVLDSKNPDMEGNPLSLKDEEIADVFKKSLS